MCGSVSHCLQEYKHPVFRLPGGIHVNWMHFGMFSGAHYGQQKLCSAQSVELLLLSAAQILGKDGAFLTFEQNENEKMFKSHEPVFYSQ